MRGLWWVDLFIMITLVPEDDEIHSRFLPQYLYAFNKEI
jgi:hypothetical protein